MAKTGTPDLGSVDISAMWCVGRMLCLRAHNGATSMLAAEDHATVAGYPPLRVERRSYETAHAHMEWNDDTPWTNSAVIIVTVVRQASHARPGTLVANQAPSSEIAPI